VRNAAEHRPDERQRMTVNRVDVALGERSYPIFIEDGLLGRAGEVLAAYARGNRLIVISEKTIWWRSAAA
jgi:3-dehydroquinate synthetase